MPSGVSHGSALPVGAALVVRSKATSAKLDGRHLLRPVILLRGLAWQVGDADHPAEAGFGSVLPRRHQPVGTVEGAGHDLDPVAVDAAKTQRRAAGGAIAAIGDRGGAEERRLSLGPSEIRPVDVGEGGERRAARLLAHPAVADRDPVRGCRDRKADRAALAAAGENGFARVGHGCSIRRKASCSVASASPPAKTKPVTPAARSAASASAGRPAR